MHSHPDSSARRPARPARRLPALLALLALLLAACGTELGQADAAAVVNETEIPVSQLEERYEQAIATPEVAAQLEADPEATQSQLEAQLLTQLVQSQLLQQGADDLGVEVTDADVAAQREQLVEQVGGEEAFQSIVDENDLSEEQLDELLRDLALQEAVTEELTAGTEVPEEEVQAFYEQNYGPTVNARHILVETEEQAQEVLDRLAAGEEFAAIAEEVSTDPGSAQQGGDLGEISQGQTVPEFDEAVFGAEVGEIVGPVQTQFGYHVIEVTGQQAAPPLEEVRDEVVAGVQGPQRQEAVQQWLQEQVAAAEVVVNPRFGEWNAEAGQVVPEEPLGAVTEVPQDAGTPPTTSTPTAPADTEPVPVPTATE